MTDYLTAARRTALAALALMAFSNLRCEPGCRERTVTLELPAAYGDYFNQLSSGAGRNVAARSSSGLTDSYTSVYVSNYGFPQPEATGCEYFQNTGRSVFYTPALYRRTFRVSVAQYAGGPQLVVEEQRPDVTSSSTYFGSEIFYPLSGTGPGRIRYYQEYGYQLAADVPVAQTLPSLTVAGRSYQNVLRLTNPYAAQQGPPSAATVYYLDRGYGLVRFEQRDGTVWDLQL